MAASDNLQENTFLGINWTLYTLCVFFFGARLYIRWICFRRLFTEDYLMVAAMVLLTAIEALSQRYADNIYHLMGWVNGTYPVTTLAELVAFEAQTEAMLEACGSAIILFLVGFYTIKINFLLFFYRMGDRLLRIYRIVWWVVFVVVVACGIISICVGVTTFKCLFNGIIYTFETCETTPYENAFYLYFRVSVALDIITDALIIGFPVWLLWGIRITLRKKIALGGIFSLVGFTIVATILRGALLTEVFTATAAGKTFNIPWVWFWFHIEFCIAFIVACLVSFRALFSQNERARSKKPSVRPVAPRQLEAGGSGSKPSAGYQSGGSTVVGQNSSNASHGTLPKSGSRLFGAAKGNSRFKIFQDSILDTCRTLEGLDGGDEDEYIDMDPLATVDHDRVGVTFELGHIGGFQNMAEGTGQTVPIRSSHDSLENLNQEAAERDSQGVSVLDPEEEVEREEAEKERQREREREVEFNANNDGPRRRDTVLSHASQLSLDSLYMSRGDHSQRPSIDTHGRR